MRLIDADALERQIQEAYCAECDDYNGIRCRACSIDDALIQVDAAPTVDAIPVEWLEDRVYDMKRAHLYRRYAEMLLMEWLQEQKEQEAARST